MAALLVSDTSVLVDLGRGDVLPALFRLSYEFGVPDLLYRDELESWNGPDLRSMGLQVLGLDPKGLQLAQEYGVRETRLSTPDTFALALARTGGHVLLAGDGNLRKLAEREGVECHGVLWLLDRLEEQGVLGPSELLVALQKITSHPRCRLPKDAVQLRFSRYRSTGPAS